MTPALLLYFSQVLLFQLIDGPTLPNLLGTHVAYLGLNQIGICSLLRSHKCLQSNPTLLFPEREKQGLSVAWSESPALCLKMLQNQSWRCVNRQQFSSASFWLGGENRSGPEPVLQHMKTHTGLMLLAVLNP